VQAKICIKTEVEQWILQAEKDGRRLLPREMRNSQEYFQGFLREISEKNHPSCFALL
jgi:hypothetical protein